MPEAQAGKKLAGKYETPEDLEKAYQEMQTLMSKQGEELGGLRQWAQQVQAQQQEYARFYEQAAPVVNWVQQNQAGLNQYQQWAARMQSGQGMHPTQPAPSVTQAAANGVNLATLLTDAERQEIGAQIFRAQMMPAFQAWSQRLGQEIRQYGQAEAQRLRDEYNQQQNAHTSVLWKALEMSTAPENLQRVKQLQEEALKLATGQLDPMALAEERLGYIGTLAQRDAELKALKDADEARQKAAIPSLGSNASLGFDTPAERPKTQADRYRNVMNQVVTDLGPEAVGHLASGSPTVQSLGRST